MFFFVLLLIDIAFAVACANIAKSKNREAALWGVLGFFFWFIPLIIIAILDKREPAATALHGHGVQAAPQALAAQPAQSARSTADEIAQWKALLDDGAISEAEFAAKKTELLGRS